VRTRIASPAILVFLLLGHSTLNAQAISKHQASRQDQVNSGEQIFKKVAPSLAALRTVKSGQTHAVASAIVLTPDGFIGTNYHATQGADEVEVTLPESGQGGPHLALKHLKLMYLDSSKDLAILKADVEGLHSLGCPSDQTVSTRVGERVYALGNPRGLESTISDGIISGLRTIYGQDVIQHTAPISPGSSGGALVDSQGNLIGMNSWQVRDSQNLNFAIPRKYLCAALAQAQHATVELTFPKDELDRDNKFAKRAREALVQHDYIEAINIGTQAIGAGESSSEIYAILGEAYSSSGNTQEAERYLLQCVLLTGNDDEFKQEARVFLLKIFTDKFKQDPASVNRTTFLKVATDFLDSKSPLNNVGDALYQECRREAASVAGTLNSINGTWIDASEDESLNRSFNDCTYKITPDDSGRFWLTTQGHETARTALTLNTFYVAGKISESDGIISGVLQKDETIVSNEDPHINGVARQSVSVVLKLSDDMMALEGTADYSDIRSSGDLSSVLLTLMKPSIGEHRIRLVRSH